MALNASASASAVWKRCFRIAGEGALEELVDPKGEIGCTAEALGNGSWHTLMSTGTRSFPGNGSSR